MVGFCGVKNAWKIDRDTRFDVLRGPFVDLEHAFRRVPKIIQNYAKIHLKSQQNEHKIIWHPVLQCSKTHAAASHAKMHQNAFIFVVPDVALPTPWIQKPPEIVENCHK